MSRALNPLVCRLLLLVAGASLALTACSSSGSSSTPSSTPSTPSSSSGSAGAPSGAVDRAFLSRANAVCATGVAYARKHPFRFTSFSGSSGSSETPPRTELPKLADYYEKTPDVVARLIALPAPSVGKPAWRKVVAVLEALQKNHETQTRAAANAERQEFKRAVQVSGTITGRLRIAAAPAGLLSATSCVTYFTG